MLFKEILNTQREKPQFQKTSIISIIVFYEYNIVMHIYSRETGF